MVLCGRNVSNSNVTTKFAQLYYFSSQNVGGDKIYYAPQSKSWGDMSPRPPLKLSSDEICTTILLFITKRWRGQNILYPPVQKLGGHVSPSSP